MVEIIARPSKTSKQPGWLEIRENPQYQNDAPGKSEVRRLEGGGNIWMV